MAIPEACGLWIEQRVKEELDQKGETGASLREIGRQVAAEVEKYFETKVNPETIRSKARRIEAGSDDPQEENAIKSKEKQQYNTHIDFENEDIPMCINGCGKPVYFIKKDGIKD